MPTFVLGLDLETTGLDHDKDRIIELGYVLWEVERKRPVLAKSFFISDGFGNISNEISKITGIYNEDFAYSHLFSSVMTDLWADCNLAQCFVGHNLKNFDLPFLKKKCDQAQISEEIKGFIHSLKAIDTMIDLDDECETNLITACARKGFLNPFSHRAMFDALSSLKLFSLFDYEKIKLDAFSPLLRLTAQIPAPWEDGGAGRDNAKKLGFKWDKEKGVWLKHISQRKIILFTEQCPFRFTTEEIRS